MRWRARPSDGKAGHALRRRRRPGRSGAHVAEGRAHPRSGAGHRFLRQAGEPRPCAPHRRWPAQPASRAIASRLSLHHRTRPRPTLSIARSSTDFYEASAERLGRAARRTARTWPLLCEGDPFFYGSYVICTTGSPSATFAGGDPRHHRHERVLDAGLLPMTHGDDVLSRAARHAGCSPPGRAPRR